MELKCKKKKFDRIKALIVIANANKPSQTNFNRKEKRIYFCTICKYFHVTSKNKLKNLKNELES
jgi:hypothetical protein